MQHRSRSALLLGTWVALAVFLLQVMWIVAVPPFGGIDEFDHAYRADYVARGNWDRPSTPAPDGRGAVVTVRKSIVEAAGPICRSFQYTGPDNCRSMKSTDSLATVATGAFAYDPAYYSLVGTPALPFEGVDALYAMRVTSAVLCSVLIGFACAALRFACGVLPCLGLLLALTPTIIYSFSIVAPNGLEIAAGAGSWAGLLALAQQPDRTQRVGFLLLATAVSCTLLAVLRPLGPLWLCMIAASVVAVRGWRPWVTLARRSPVPFWAAVAAVAIGTGRTLASVFQTGGREFVPGDGVTLPNNGWAVALDQSLVWVFQGVGAFPTRTEPAPLIVYALQIGALVTWLVAGLVNGRGAPRVTLALVLVASLVAPAVIAAELLGPLAITWQGRYTLPFAVGGAVLSGLALGYIDNLGRLGGAMTALVGLALIGAQVISAGDVYQRQLAKSAAQATGWPFFPAWSLGVAALLAGLAFAAAASLLARPEAVPVSSGRPDL